MRDVTKQYKKPKRELLEYDMFFENTFLRLKWNRQALTEGHNLIHDTVRTTNADIFSNVDQTISRLINCWPAEYLFSLLCFDPRNCCSSTLICSLVHVLRQHSELDLLLGANLFAKPERMIAVKSSTIVFFRPNLATKTSKDKLKLDYNQPIAVKLVRNYQKTIAKLPSSCGKAVIQYSGSCHLAIALWSCI